MGEQLEGLGKTIRQAAREADVNNVYLGRIIKDEVKPSPEILKKLSKPLHLHYETLMRAAGYLPAEERPHRPKVDILASASDELNDDEIDMVLRVVEDIKRLRKQREE